jgi:hypothetical protein
MNTWKLVTSKEIQIIDWVKRLHSPESSNFPPKTPFAPENHRFTFFGFGHETFPVWCTQKEFKIYRLYIEKKPFFKIHQKAMPLCFCWSQLKQTCVYVTPRRFKFSRLSTLNVFLQCSNLHEKSPFSQKGEWHYHSID